MESNVTLLNRLYSLNVYKIFCFQIKDLIFFIVGNVLFYKIKN